MSYSVGEAVRIAREKMGISQIQIATYLGVDQSFISRCEKDQRQFSIDMLEKISNLLGCDYEDLEDGNDIQPNVQFAFLASSIEQQDLKAIASINKIISNVKEMKRLLRRRSEENERGCRMKIETKYDVDDKVWKVEKSYSKYKYYAKSAIVWMLQINVYEKEKANIGYCLRGYAGCFYDSELFATEDEAEAECIRLNEILEREKRGE